MTVQQSVVRDAAYTSWAMWRWANGDIVPALQSLTKQRFTPAFIEHLLRSEDARDAAFALAHITEHHPDDEQYLEYLRQPLFYDNRPNQYYDPEPLLEQFEQIFSSTKKPVAGSFPRFLGFQTKRLGRNFQRLWRRAG